MKWFGNIPHIASRKEIKDAKENGEELIEVGKEYIGFDKGVKETTVKGYYHNGKFYITDIIERDIK